jgi:hypothetical protein
MTFDWRGPYPCKAVLVVTPGPVATQGSCVVYVGTLGGNATSWWNVMETGRHEAKGEIMVVNPDLQLRPHAKSVLCCAADAIRHCAENRAAPCATSNSFVWQACSS